MRSIFRSLPRALPYVRPYWMSALLSIVLLVLGVLVSLAGPWPLAFLVDQVLTGERAPGLIEDWFGTDTTTLILVAVGTGLAISLAGNGLNVVQEYVNTRLHQRMVLDFRSDLFKNAQRLSLAYHDNRRTGDFMARINFMAGAIGLIVVGLPPLAQSCLTLVGMFFVAYRIEPSIALLAMTVVPFIYYSTGYYSRRVEPRIVQVREMEGQSLSIVHEAMSMLRVIVAFGRENHEFDRFRTQGEDAVGARVRLTVRQTLFSLVVNAITAVGTALVLYVGARHVIAGRLSIGQLLVVMSYIAAVYTPLTMISSTLANLQEQMVSFRLSLELLDAEPEIQDARNAVSLGRAEGRVTFDRVAFSYEGREHTLRDISFEAEPGAVVAIVGPTGAGKSTLISLLPRFYDPLEGAVLLDDYDLRELTLDSLRRQISIVLQDPLLFRGSIAHNIRYGRLDATEDEIIEAARAANAHEFIAALPRGYDTMLGERGAQLSGGERQRICIARAFLKDAPLLILDEPTSAIDSRTEGVILEALDRLMVGRTTFIIAHRLSTVRRATQILVIDGGRLVEHGRHEELLQLNGLYSELYEAQVGTMPERGGVASADRLVAATSNGNGNGNGNGSGNGKRNGNGNGATKPVRYAPDYLNRASAAELATLPGVTLKMAESIVEERARLGRFRTADDLLVISGIGPSRLERIRAVAHRRANELATETVDHA